MRNHINRSSNRYRINTLSAAISVALLPLAAPVVHAQSADEPQLEEVVVTGSRITRFEGDYTAPVLSLGADRIEQSGNVNIEDFVSEVGALVGSSGSFQTQRDDGGAQAGDP